MVSTRSSINTLKSDEPDRVIAIVTGANSGVGLGLCHRLLSIYSLPPGHVIQEGLPQTTALVRKAPDAGARAVVTTGPTLTLVLAVRNKANGEKAKVELLERLQELMIHRDRREGLSYNFVKKWRNELEIEVEEVDFDTPYGEKGILAFTERIKDTYPHVTSLYVNAGIMASIAVLWHRCLYEVFRVGPFKAFAYPDRYMSEHMGRMSQDGERGQVWGVNVLAPFILARELMPLLRRSPPTVSTPPRIVYTTSSTARLSAFDDLDLDDSQMLTYPQTYSTSKYAGDLVINELDREYHPDEYSGVAAISEKKSRGSNTSQGSEEKRAVRCIAAEPAIVMTNVARESWKGYSILIPILAYFQNVVFVLCRFLGSPYHVRDGEDAATGLLYASLVPDRYLPPSTDEVPRKFGLHAHQMSSATVEVKELDNWESPRAREIAKGQMKACEVVWKEARRREGLE